MSGFTEPGHTMPENRLAAALRKGGMRLEADSSAHLYVTRFGYRLRLREDRGQWWLCPVLDQGPGEDRPVGAVGRYTALVTAAGALLDTMSATRRAALLKDR